MIFSLKQGAKMADLDDIKDGKDFGLAQSQTNRAFI